MFRDGDDEVFLQSRELKPLGRYFPELVVGLGQRLSRPCVLDGEIVIEREGVLDFDALSQRIHPAASRIELLAQQTPAGFVAWDLLALDDDDHRANAATTSSRSPLPSSWRRSSPRRSPGLRSAPGRAPLRRTGRATLRRSARCDANPAGARWRGRRRHGS